MLKVFAHSISGAWDAKGATVEDCARAYARYIKENNFAAAHIGPARVYSDEIRSIARISYDGKITMEGAN